jgi:hypothetical protein
MGATCPVHPILLDLIMGKERSIYKKRKNENREKERKGYQI